MCVCVLLLFKTTSTKAELEIIANHYTLLKST